MNFLDQLRTSAKNNDSIASMGLDPDVNALPDKLRDMGIVGFELFCEEVFTEMLKQKVLPGAFKPNQGFYIKHDVPLRGNNDGSATLNTVMGMVQRMFPGTPLILDFKRGDIAKSSANYASEGFTTWQSDAVTVSPYMGTDSVGPFIESCNDEKGKGVYILNRTSNKGASDFQNLEVVTSREGGSIQTKPLYMSVADKISEWAARKPGVGAVVGATSLDELKALADHYVYTDVALLIPGVGGQGGKAEDVVSILKDTGYELLLARVNSSSGITHPWVKKKEPAPADYAKIVVEKLHELNEGLRKAA